MSELNSEEVEHLASLSRLSLTDEEREDFSKTLPQVLSFVDELKKGGELNPSSGDGFNQGKLREDVEGSDSLSLEQLEKLAPYWQKNPPAGGQVEIPPVFGESGNE